MMYKFKPSKCVRTITAALATTVLVGFSYNVIQRPELYSTTLRYQLKNDIQAGQENAIEYYNGNYASQGIELFEDDTMLDMTTVVDYEVSEEGLYLHTNDGNGYWLEIRK